MPFETTPAGDPLQAGRQRLKGAFLIDVTRIRPDPKPPRGEFDDAKLKELTNSVTCQESASNLKRMLCCRVPMEFAAPVKGSDV